MSDEQGSGEKLNRIEEMKSRLFSKSYRTEIEHRDVFRHSEQTDVPDSWARDPEMASKKSFFMKTSFFKKFFVFAVIFFVMALGYASYTFFMGGNTVSNNNIDISVTGNTFTAGGEDLPLQINIANKNSSALELVDLVMEYPNGSSNPSTQSNQHFRESLGTIPAGTVRSENVSVTLLGEEGSVQPIQISIEYRVEGSNAIFIKEKEYDVTISSTPIDLSVNAPTTVSPNQDIVLNIQTALNAQKVAPAMMLRVDYPAGFQFESATPAPSFGNNVWSLGDMSPGATRSISVTGKMIDVSDGEQKTFRISSGSQSDTDKSLIGVIFNSAEQTMTIQKPFIDAKLFINGVYQRQYATDSKTPIQGEIQWTNNLDTKVNNLSIVAKVSGNALDRKSIQANQGVYDSSANTITWDKNSEASFAEVDPGDSGSVTFSMNPLSLFSAGGGILSSPSITIDVSISGQEATQGNAVQSITNGESKTIQIISDVGFANKVLSSSGAFVNTGPIPPKAEAETTYTVVWTLSNTANNISNATVTSTLPSWVRFVGPISPKTEDLTYDPSSGNIVWNVGSIAKGTGITTASRQASFQIGFTPSLSQVGTSPVLINDAVLTGHDDFANVNVRVNKASLNTDLQNDPAFPQDGGRVTD